jgi:thiamine biosynthesis lipoprotein ApbE
MQRPHWRLDPAARTAVHLDDAPIVLNSFTKSFIVDRAAAAGLAIGGVQGIVVNVGGDLAVRGRWSEPVGITNPTANADNDRRSIASSSRPCRRHERRISPRLRHRRRPLLAHRRSADRVAGRACPQRDGRRT